MGVGIRAEVLGGLGWVWEIATKANCWAQRWHTGLVLMSTPPLTTPFSSHPPQAPDQGLAHCRITIFSCWWNGSEFNPLTPVTQNVVQGPATSASPVKLSSVESQVPHANPIPRIGVCIFKIPNVWTALLYPALSLGCSQIFHWPDGRPGCVWVNQSHNIGNYDTWFHSKRDRFVESQRCDLSNSCRNCQVQLQAKWHHFFSFLCDKSVNIFDKYVLCISLKI